MLLCSIVLNRQLEWKGQRVELCHSRSRFVDAGNAAIAQKGRDRKRRAVGPLSATAPTTRKQRQAAAANQDARNTSSSAMRTHQSTPPALPFTDFVREMAQKYKWTEQRTRDVCAGIHQSLDLYRSRKLKAFYEAVMQATPGTRRCCAVCVIADRTLRSDSRCVMASLMMRRRLADGSVLQRQRYTQAVRDTYVLALIANASLLWPSADSSLSSIC